ncbi:MAG: sigma-70 family RNA polymerase sigma factor [Bacilli bacterium]|nr:sigma-70 family RNA polymerase sigma factor [Bacilli bacterium]
MKDELRLKLSLGNPKSLKETYEYLFNEHKGLVAFIASCYLSSKDDIDDVIEDAFLELFNNPDKVKSSIKGFLSGHAKGKALTRLKEIQKVDLIEDDTLLGVVNSDIEHALLIDQLKEVLKDNEFNIIVMHLLDDLTFKEVGSRLNIKENTVKTTYFRALEKCRKLLEE